jgi:hypothetical protein
MLRQLCLEIRIYLCGIVDNRCLSRRKQNLHGNVFLLFLPGIVLPSGKFLNWNCTFRQTHTHTMQRSCCRSVDPSSFSSSGWGPVKTHRPQAKRTICMTTCDDRVRASGSALTNVHDNKGLLLKTHQVDWTHGTKLMNMAAGDGFLSDRRRASRLRLAPYAWLNRDNFL